MKNVFDVLRQKETELQQIQKEIDALRFVARLLAEDEYAETDAPMSRTAVPPAVLTRPSAAVPAATVTPAPPLRPGAPTVGGEGYSAARDNALRQFP